MSCVPLERGTQIEGTTRAPGTSVVSRFPEASAVVAAQVEEGSGACGIWGSHQGHHWRLHEIDGKLQQFFQNAQIMDSSSAGGIFLDWTYFYSRSEGVSVPSFGAFFARCVEKDFVHRYPRCVAEA